MVFADPSPLVSVVLGTIGATAVGLVAWGVFHVNSSLWATTRSSGRPPKSIVALTFDDGPDPLVTPAILSILAQEDVSAAFFVVGQHVRRAPELVQRVHAAGHLVGNHSDTHGFRLHIAPRATVLRELVRCNAAIFAAIDREPTLYRAPHGFKRPALGDVLQQLGMTAVGWQARGFDTVENDPAKITARIFARLRPGGVVLMHDGTHGRGNRLATLAALPRVIAGVRQRGWTFVRLDELLDVAGYQACLPDVGKVPFASA